MKESIKEAVRHPLITGSAFIFVGSLFGNVFNFLFNLYMTRNLPISDYGTLASLVSLIALFGILPSSIMPTVVRFAASYFAKKQYAMVQGLFFRIGVPALLVGIVTFVSFAFFSEPVSRFFKIDDSFLFFLVGLIISLSFLGTINYALLQAKLAFKFISFSNVIAAAMKLVLGVALVAYGFGIRGAMWAFFASFSIAYLLSFFPLRFIFHARIKTISINIRDLFVYGAPSALTVLSLTSLTTVDIMLVKHFFDPENAGVYSGLSLVGRVIFFLSAPIGTVMFPLVVQKHEKQENYHSVFRLAFILVLLPSLFITIFYFFFPQFSMQFFTKQDKYLAAFPYLATFGVFITVYSLLSIVTNFFLSVKKTKVFIPLCIGSVCQAVLIWFYHETFSHVIAISLAVVSLLLIGFLLYYWKLYGKKSVK